MRDVEAPVYLTGAFQDEQTGPQFTAMVDDFDRAALARVNLWNGRHPDGFGPANLVRWYEFLELYVADRVPVLHPVLRAVLPIVLADQFDLADVALEPDHYASFGDDLDAARAAYEAEPPVRAVFESGLGQNEVGEPGGTFELALDAWPAPDAEPATWYLGGGGALVPDRAERGARGRLVPLRPGCRGRHPVRRHRRVPAAVPHLGHRLDPVPGGHRAVLRDRAVRRGHRARGPGYAELYVASDAEDVHVQVSVSEIQAGRHRGPAPERLARPGPPGRGPAAHRRAGDRPPLHRARPGADGARRVRGGPHRHPVDRPPGAGRVRLRLSVATPGRNHATWEFENPTTGLPRRPTRWPGPGHAVRAGAVHPRRRDGAAGCRTLPCPGLRGQACRPYQPVPNTEAEEG